MKTFVENKKWYLFILVALLAIFSIQGTSQAQAGNPTLTASLPDLSDVEPLTEAMLDGTEIILTLRGGKFVKERWTILDALTFSSINTVQVLADKWGDLYRIHHRREDLFNYSLFRVSDAQVRITLDFTGNIDTDKSLVITVDPEAIVDYDGPPLTAEIPVLAVEESLEASTEFPLTEANLHGNVITLTLYGRTFRDAEVILDNLSVSGVGRVLVRATRISDTKTTLELVEFRNNIDKDATLGLTVEGRAFGYNKSFTFEFPVTATETIPVAKSADTNAVVSISPASVTSPDVGRQLKFDLNITDAEAVAGYQATVQFDTAALRYVSGTNGDYLPTGAFFVEPKVEGNLIKLNAASLAGESSGDGTLATLTFEVITVKASTLTLSDVLLTNSDGEAFVPKIENAEITESIQLKADVNADGTVNIQDLVLVAGQLGQTGTNSADVNADGTVNIQDLVLVAGALGTSAAAPSLSVQALSNFRAADVELWVSQAHGVDLTDARMQRGVAFLEQLLAVLTPKETALLANYPNPFNPETWIPYQLSKPADVTLTIYAANGQVVRQLALGHQPAGIYQSRTRAAYWDGRNEVGEPVASGLYFYTLTAGDFTTTRKMLIRK